MIMILFYVLRLAALAATVVGLAGFFSGQPLIGISLIVAGFFGILVTTLAIQRDGQPPVLE